MTKIYISTRPQPIRHRRKRKFSPVPREDMRPMLDRVFPDLGPTTKRRRDHLSLFLWLAMPTWVLASLALPWLWIPGFFIIWFFGSIWA